MRSEHPELKFGGIGHLAAVPGRIENDLDACVSDAGNRSHLLLHVGRQLLGGWAVGRSERHADVNGALGGDGHAVDQPELVDVDGDLGVVAGA